MQLRRWQKEAIASALKKFSVDHAHFLCLATPGAGKTFMASALAKRLFHANKIDLVLCFTPSVNIASSFQHTLESVLKRRIDGRIGASGQVITYQSMLNFGESFWSLLDLHRTLVIFDEIHHCAGDNEGNANVWGQKILQFIQGKATYTLALTGTPWRSDRIPIALSSYAQNGQVRCDYRYGLSDAIQDGVCRTPKITVTDNDRIIVNSGTENDVYTSFADLLKNSKCTYQNILNNESLIQHLLKKSIQKLNAIRKKDPDAGGLIVAASVEHAMTISDYLHQATGKTPFVVTYVHDDSQRVIKEFRNSSSPWIVSVGMISEGTDIPRLRVCCHLTKVKTELYFRQVLGRVLRVQHSSQEQAYLFMPAEPNLIEYAERVAEDVPRANTVSLDLMVQASDLSNYGGPQTPENSADEIKTPLEIILSEDTENSLLQAPPKPTVNTPTEVRPIATLSASYDSAVGLFGKFKNRMIKVSLLNS